MTMKYVNVNLLGADNIVLFPQEIAHKEMVEAIRFMKIEDGMGRWGRDYVDLEVVSAGFVTESGHCYGRSESLDKDSRPEDTSILQAQYA